MLQSLCFQVYGFSPSLHLKTWELATDGLDTDRVGEQGLCFLVLTTFQPGVEELDIGIVAGCDCVQVKGGKEEDVDFTVGDKGVFVEETGSALVDGKGTLELRTTW